MISGALSQNVAIEQVVRRDSTAYAQPVLPGRTYEKIFIDNRLSAGLGLDLSSTFHTRQADQISQRILSLRNSLNAIRSYVGLRGEALEIDPPAALVYEIAEAMIPELARENLMPERVSYSADGGLCFVFRNGTRRLHMEVYNDGDSGYIVEDEKRRSILANENVTRADILPAIKNFLMT